MKPMVWESGTPDKLGHPMIVCSYKLFEYCLRRYKKRDVHADRHVEFDDFYYFNRRGQVRIVVNKTQVWIEHPVKGWPFILRRRG